jgi:hypothetical protein
VAEGSVVEKVRAGWDVFVETGEAEDPQETRSKTNTRRQSTGLNCVFMEISSHFGVMIRRISMVQSVE